MGCRNLSRLLGRSRYGLTGNSLGLNFSGCLRLNLCHGLHLDDCLRLDFLNRLGLNFENRLRLDLCLGLNLGSCLRLNGGGLCLVHRFLGGKYCAAE